MRSPYHPFDLRHLLQLLLDDTHVLLRLRDRLYKLMAEYTGKTPEQIHRDFDRNKWLFAEEAVAYGCADKVLDRAPETAAKPRTAEENDERL